MRRLFVIITTAVAGLGAAVILMGLDHPRSDTPSLYDIRDPVEFHRATYADYFGVDLQTAEAQIALSPIVANLEQSLAGEYGEVFAGLWIQHKPEYRVVVAMTSETPGVEAVRALASDELDSLIEYRIHERTAATLKATAAAVELSGIPHNLNVDLTTNRVVVEVLSQDIETARRLLEKVDAISIVEVPTLGGPDANVYGGTHLTGNGCTAGFAVKKNGTNTTGLTTAGHCGNVAGFNGQNFPHQGEVWAGNTDAQWHTTPNFTDQPWIRWNPQGDAFEVHAWVGHGGTNIGDWLCKYGRTTGNKCGEVESKNWDPGYVPGAGAVFIVLRNCGLDLGSGGDSGGPVWGDDSLFAYAMHSGSVWGGIGCGGDKALVNSLTHFQGPLGVTILEIP